MENKINAFATSCYRFLLNIKRIDHVLNTTVYSMTNTVPLILLVRHRQLKFLGHILRMSKEEPARRYALYIPTIGKRRPCRPRTSYLNYVQRLLGDNEGAMQEQQIAAFADDRCAWRNLVVACSAADGWWWQKYNSKNNGKTTRIIVRAHIERCGKLLLESNKVISRGVITIINIILSREIKKKRLTFIRLCFQHTFEKKHRSKYQIIWFDSTINPDFKISPTNFNSVYLSFWVVECRS